MSSPSKVARAGSTDQVMKNQKLREQLTTFNSQTANQAKNTNPNQKSINQPQKLVKFTFPQIKSKANSVAIEYLKSKLKISTFTQGIFNSLQQIKKSTSMTTFFQQLFNFIKDSILQSPIYVNIEPLQKSLLVVIRQKQSKKLRIVREQEAEKKKKSKESKNLQIAQKTNQQIKIQLFKVREENNVLQNKIVKLVQKYKETKQFYIAEIKKLTQIINTASKDMKNLAVLKTKQAKIVQESYQKSHQKQQSGIKVKVSNFSTTKQQNLRETNRAKQFISISPPVQKHVSYFQNPTDNSKRQRKLSNVSSIQLLEQQAQDD